MRLRVGVANVADAAGGHRRRHSSRHCRGGPHVILPVGQPPGGKAAHACRGRPLPPVRPADRPGHRRRIEAKQREQYQAALEQARAEALAAAEQKVAGGACGSQAGGRGGGGGQARRNPGRACPGRAGQGRGPEQMAALKAAQEAAVEKRVAEIQESLQRRRGPAAGEGCRRPRRERRKVLKLQSELQDMQRKLERQVGATSSAKAPRSTCSSSSRTPSRATASSASARASTAPT